MKLIFVLRDLVKRAFSAWNIYRGLLTKNRNAVVDFTRIRDVLTKELQLYMVNTKENIDKITVITINLNDVAGLEKTINSVLNQTYENIDFIVIDGLSNDGSVELIGKYGNKIDYWCSEKDKGVYDAMNKGVQKAKGDWIHFLNSGDIFYNQHTLSNVFRSKSLAKKDVLYGSVVRRSEISDSLSKPSELCAFFYKLPFCHQSSFVKTELLKRHPFNIKFKIAADYNFFCQAYAQNFKFYNLNLPIAIFLDGGISTTQTTEMYHEYEFISVFWFEGMKRKKMYLHYRLHVLKRKLKMIFNAICS